jgi:hypothetical protein
LIVEYGSSDCRAPGESHRGTRNLLVGGGEVVAWMPGGLRGGGTWRSSGAQYPTGGNGGARRGIAPQGNGGGGSRGSGGGVSRGSGGVGVGGSWGSGGGGGRGSGCVDGWGGSGGGGNWGSGGRVDRCEGGVSGDGEGSGSKRSANRRRRSVAIVMRRSDARRIRGCHTLTLLGRSHLVRFNG